jgi:hypothetical protein
MKIESELRFGPTSFVARRRFWQVLNSFRILGFELGFARLSLQLMKRIFFSFYLILSDIDVSYESETGKLK